MREPFSFEAFKEAQKREIERIKSRSPTQPQYISPWAIAEMRTNFEPGVHVTSSGTFRVDEQGVVTRIDSVGTIGPSPTVSVPLSEVREVGEQTILEQQREIREAAAKLQKQVPKEARESRIIFHPTKGELVARFVPERPTEPLTRREQASVLASQVHPSELRRRAAAGDTLAAEALEMEIISTPEEKRRAEALASTVSRQELVRRASQGDVEARRALIASGSLLKKSEVPIEVTAEGITIKERIATEEKNFTPLFTEEEQRMLEKLEKYRSEGKYTRELEKFVEEQKALEAQINAEPNNIKAVGLGVKSFAKNILIQPTAFLAKLEEFKARFKILKEEGFQKGSAFLRKEADIQRNLAKAQQAKAREEFQKTREEIKSGKRGLFEGVTKAEAIKAGLFFGSSLLPVKGAGATRVVTGSKFVLNREPALTVGAGHSFITESGKGAGQAKAITVLGKPGKYRIFESDIARVMKSETTGGEISRGKGVSIVETRELTARRPETMRSVVKELDLEKKVGELTVGKEQTEFAINLAFGRAATETPKGLKFSNILAVAKSTKLPPKEGLFTAPLGREGSARFITASGYRDVIFVGKALMQNEGSRVVSKSGIIGAERVYKVSENLKPDTLLSGRATKQRVAKPDTAADAAAKLRQLELATAQGQALKLAGKSVRRKNVVKKTADAKVVSLPPVAGISLVGEGTDSRTIAPVMGEGRTGEERVVNIPITLRSGGSRVSTIAPMAMDALSEVRLERQRRLATQISASRKRTLENFRSRAFKETPAERSANRLADIMTLAAIASRQRPRQTVSLQQRQLRRESLRSRLKTLLRPAQNVADFVTPLPPRMQGRPRFIPPILPFAPKSLKNQQSGFAFFPRIIDKPIPGPRKVLGGFSKKKKRAKAKGGFGSFEISL